MSKIKKTILTLFTLLLMIVGVSVPTNAKHVRHHRIHVTRKVRVNHKRYRHHVYKYRHHRRYYYKHHKRRYRYKRYKKRHHYKKKARVYRKKRNKQKHYRKTKPKPKSLDLPSVAQFSKRDFDDINNDRQSNNLPPLSNDKSLQKIAIDRVKLAYFAWQHNWNSHGTDGKTKTAAQLGFDSNSKDYNPNIALISENNALSYRSIIPETSSLVDGRMNYFPPDDVSTPTKVVDTNNDIYMNHDVGADGQSGHRANILGTGINAVGTAIYQKNGCYVQDEVFGYVYN